MWEGQWKKISFNFKNYFDQLWCPILSSRFFFLGAKIVGRIAEKGGQVGAHHCKVAGTSKVFRKRKPTTSRRQSQTQAEKRFKEGEQHNGFSDTDFILYF